MPTNLKSLLSRSRSRNELKLREKGDESGSVELSNECGGGSGNGSNGGGGGGQCHCDVLHTNCTSGPGLGNGGAHRDVGGSGQLRRDPSCKSFFSCSALYGVGVVDGDGTGTRDSSSRTTTTCLCPNPNPSGSGSSDTSTDTFSSSSILSSSSSRCRGCIHNIPVTTTTSSSHERESSQNLSIRKCETVLALSSFTGSPSPTHHQQQKQQHPHHSPSASSSPPINPSFSAMATSSPMSGRSDSPGSPLPLETHATSGRVKVMKDKIFSTSSSTLNSLIHGSNRTTSKFFAGWKFSSNGASGSHGGGGGVGGGVGGGGTNSCSTASSNHEISGSNHGVNTTLLLSVGAPSPLTDSLHTPFSSSNLLHGMALSGKKSKSQLSISDTGNGTPLTPVNRLRRNVSVNNSYCCFSNNPALCGPYSRSSSVTSFTWKEDHQGDIFCRLCLSHFNLCDTVELQACSCRYCKDCLVAYMSFEIQEGAYEIACPDASCDKEGVLTLAEIETLVPKPLMEKHRKFRLYREVEKDAQVMWCPSPGCETVCFVEDVGEKCRPGCSTTSITCTTCSKTFCAECKLTWHPDTSCESFRRKLVKQGKLSVDDEELYSIESIKKCPFCHVPIEKDSGCAQMMCKRCKHVFCWYCLASLDDDFLLRHYDKGPCKNKLGHSRASVVWHRAQVIGIFAGFGVLVLLASPLLILAAPCLLCCRCRYCANKLDPEDPISL